MCPALRRSSAKALNAGGQPLCMVEKQNFGHRDPPGVGDRVGRRVARVAADCCQPISVIRLLVCSCNLKWAERSESGLAPGALSGQGGPSAGSVADARARAGAAGMGWPPTGATESARTRQPCAPSATDDPPPDAACGRLHCRRCAGGSARGGWTDRARSPGSTSRRDGRARSRSISRSSGRFVDADQRDRVALDAGAAGPADAVDVVLGDHRQLEVDDVRERVDVDAARGDLGRDQERRRGRP